MEDKYLDTLRGAIKLQKNCHVLKEQCREWILEINSKRESPLIIDDINKIIEEEYEGDSVWFIERKFIPKKLADFIMGLHFFKSIPNSKISTIYVYKDGVYENNGESIIKKEANSFLHEKVKNLYINEVIGCIERSTYIYPDQINQNPFIINIKNGLYDLKEKKIIPHNPEIFSITQLPIIYDPEAKCPEIQKFIREIVNEKDITIIQELFGYLLWKNYMIQKAFMFLGEGANGKSTLIRIMKEFLGFENISTISLQDLDKNPFAKASLYGKMANLYPDISDVALQQTGTFKTLTGGDSISAEFKYKDRFSFISFAKLIFSCNKLPETRDFTTAFFRRWIFINFPNKFEGKDDDKQLINKLINKKELSGLFNWALEGLERLLINQDFSYSMSTEETEIKYKKMSSSVAGFVEDMCEQDGEKEIAKADLYIAYCKYCKELNLIADNDVNFHKKLPIYAPYIKQSQPRVGDKRIRFWKGIGLINEKEIKDNRISDFIEEEL